jgi:VWFA-related protein
MRGTLLVAGLGLFTLVMMPGGGPLPSAVAQEAAPVEYGIEIDKNASSEIRDQKRFVTVDFRLRRLQDKVLITDIPKDEIVVEEDGVRVAELDIAPPRAQKLTVVLAMDISGSMARHGKMEAARQAALLFLDKLDSRAGAGLITFDHQIRVAEKPGNAPDHRDRLRQLVQSAQPQGGTAYLNATVEAVKMLQGLDGRKVVVLMTDGVDMNSKVTLKEAIEAAQTAEVPVYTLGIGEPGRNDPVTTVLVLDRSGSMMGKADDGDAMRKIDALKGAASRFVELMRPGAKTTLLPFSSQIDRPEAFTDKKEDLKQRIQGLKAQGGTLLYDATYAGVEALVAERLPGKKAVVVLTDGKDESPGSRRSDQAVIERAKEAGIPLYMLGLGRRHEIAEDVMKSMAKATGGDYYHAGSEHKLLEVFENLSIELHDDGIDEESLRSLADKTGGRYTHVSKIGELRFIYEKLADDLQKTYRVTFPSRRSTHDGTARGIDVKVMRGGRLLSTVGSVDDVARGVVVPQMDLAVYLGFLTGLCLLLAVPGLLRRVTTRGT